LFLSSEGEPRFRTAAARQNVSRTQREALPLPLSHFSRPLSGEHFRATNSKRSEKEEKREKERNRETEKERKRERQKRGERREERSEREREEEEKRLSENFLSLCSSLSLALSTRRGQRWEIALYSTF